MTGRIGFSLDRDLPWARRFGKDRVAGQPQALSHFDVVSLTQLIQGDQVPLPDAIATGNATEVVASDDGMGGLSCCDT